MPNTVTNFHRIGILNTKNPRSFAWSVTGSLQGARCILEGFLIVIIVDLF